MAWPGTEVEAGLVRPVWDQGGARPRQTGVGDPPWGGAMLRMSLDSWHTRSPPDNSVGRS